ncbi:phenylalanine--tRNA ligase subunit beta [Helicobacter sp. MIT 00-7814]|uniref:phenylalanine--tRNA ligase subunit beta n=1 Tax=unclassified Helicobacter TaxID=2593540 RepID=UPI000E1E987B|nr:MULTISPECIES: phenylalanine--tRNA ligase subunit beta [unclassified Helicobacter]RDU52205.1 phenylalanine--tRNA ligase subunit beta [Helicobacter sp. MIT 00-7814]RDU52218.1 phenylalanine--tRNA ligase subunit beta [Helicobacter sp. MIT 99-10781]
MIITKNLLSRFVDMSGISCERLCERLNSIGLEVESVKILNIPKKVVVGKVLSKSPHPDADKLSVCEVNVGSEVLQIVCGAKNVAKDQFVAVALIGAVLPKPNGEMLEIKKSILRGVESQGMLCSSTELGLPAVGEGIMVLDKSAGKLVLGSEIANLALFDDYVIELSITPNRGDCLSVLGIARDISACFDLRLKPINDIDNILALGLGRVLGVSVENKLYSCLLYRIVEIKEMNLPLNIALTLALNGTLKADVVQNFLEYATYMTGVILNAYRLEETRTRGQNDEDSNSLEVQLNIKKNAQGVEIVSVQDKILSSIGIKHLDTKFQTKSEVIIIEASFVPPRVISEIVFDKKLEVCQEVFYRSSRGSNPNLEQGMNFLCQSMLESSDVLIYSGTHNVEQYSQETKIKTTFAAISEIIGNVLSKEEMTEILKRLKFEIDVTCDENFFMVTVPNYRHDISNIGDLTEEILRIRGIDSIVSKPLEFSECAQLSTHYLQYKKRREIAHALLANGLNECIHYVFASSSELARLGFVEVDSELGLLNPIVSELDTLRTSLIPAMLASSERNANFGYKAIGLFEIGSVYDTKRAESTRLCVFVSEMAKAECFPHTKGVKWDFYSFASLVSNAIGAFSLQNALGHAHSAKEFARFGFKAESGAESEESNAKFPELLHPYQCGFVYQNGVCVGFIAKLNPRFGNGFVCEIALENLQNALPQMQEFSRFQKSQRDLTLLLDSKVEFYKIRQALENAQIPNLESVYPMDIFAESADKIALSLRLILRSPNATLEDKDLQEASKRVLEVLEQKFDAKLKM